jgi:hypothetical protein
MVAPTLQLHAAHLALKLARDTGVGELAHVAQDRA